MLYTSVDDFFSHIDQLKCDRLTREEEKELARKMQDGNEDAKKLLFDSYLPVLASFLKRYTRNPSLDMVYKGMELLHTSIETFDFQYDSPSPNVTFVHFLSDKVRRMMTRYIADNHIG